MFETAIPSIREHRQKGPGLTNLRWRGNCQVSRHTDEEEPGHRRPVRLTLTLRSLSAGRRSAGKLEQVIKFILKTLNVRGDCKHVMADYGPATVSVR